MSDANNSEREAFEAWWHEGTYPNRRCDHRVGQIVDDYNAFEIWQSARQSAPPQTPAPQGARHEGGEREDEQETAEFWHRCYSEACDKINEQDVEIKRLRAATTHPGYAASPVSTGADAKDAARYVQETERLRAALAEVVWAFDKRWHAESERKRTAAISPRMEEAFNDARLLLAGNSPEAALAAMSDEAGKV